MKFQNHRFRYYLVSFAWVLMVSLTSARAQSVNSLASAKPQSGAASDAKTETKSDTKSEAKPESDNGEVKDLKSKVEQLQSLIEQQQRTLTEMQKRLDDLSNARVAPVTATKADGTTVVSPDLHTAAIEVAQPAKPAPASPPIQAAKSDKPILTVGWGPDHAFIRSGDGKFETQISGYGQFDFRGYQSGNHPPNTFLVRRARISAEGRVAQYFDFKVEGDFADTASTLLRDFYVNVHRINELQFRFGQFKEPFSQEELRSDIYQDFVERSLVNNLAPSRSPGLMVSGVIDKGVFEYQLGSFNGKGLLALNNNGTPESALRLRFAPWKNSDSFLTRGLAFGGAYAQGRSFGGTSFRGQTESRSFTYFSPDTVNGKVTRANGEMTWTLGPAAIRAEYDQTNQARDNLGVQGRNLPGVVAKGFMAQATYMLTGENKPDAGPIVPKHNLFDGDNGHNGFGAWELKFRYSDLQVADGTIKSNRAHTFFFGPNWYLNRYVKYLLDLGFENYRDPLRTPKPGEHNYFVVLSRIQVTF